MSTDYVRRAVLRGIRAKAAHPFAAPARAVRIAEIRRMTKRHGAQFAEVFYEKPDGSPLTLAQADAELQALRVVVVIYKRGREIPPAADDIFAALGNAVAWDELERRHIAISPANIAKHQRAP